MSISLQELKFEIWQKSECNRLGISIDEHNRVLEILSKFYCAGLGYPYEEITGLIDKTISIEALKIYE